MKKLVSFCLAAILFSACSSPKISPEPIAEQVIPQFDLSKQYYAHFVVNFEDGTSVTMNTVELNESHWVVNEPETVIPNIVHIQEALGYETLETLRGKPVKGTEISINTTASISPGGSTVRSSGGFFCPDYSSVFIVPRYQCLNQLIHHAQNAHISPYAIQVGGGVIVYCDAIGTGYVNSAAWLSHEVVNAF